MTINCKGNLVDVSQPKVMGILNITPDSFYDGGKLKTDIDILTLTEKMCKEGATFIDVGAYSSRPGASHITVEKELQRIVPVITLLCKNFPELLLSVDTFRSKVAHETVSLGAAMVNDISAGTLDKEMFTTIAKLQIPYVMMHMQGTPQSMQENPSYKDIIVEVYQFFSQQLFQLKQLKVNDVIIDVGFGFGKTLTHNYQLLKNLSYFKNLEVPILAGLSRKSMLYKPLKIDASQVLNATTVAHTIALLNGANILRVHDVKEAIEAVKIVSQLTDL